MALSTAYFTGRITSGTIPILGTPSDALKTDIVARAVQDYMEIMDFPYISASLSVTASTGSGPYAIPSTIDRLVAIYNAESTPKTVSYAYDAVKRQITFEDDISTDETWTCYGIPDSIITNLSTIIAAIPERHEKIIWAYIRYEAYDWQGHDDADKLLKIADYKARMARKARNKLIDAYGTPMQYKDVRGNRIGDKYNAEGFTTAISENYSMDL